VHNRANANTAIGSRTLENNNGAMTHCPWLTGPAPIFSPGSNNIYIGNVGLTGEDGTIRIGDASQTRTYIAGIAASSVTGAPVSVNDNGQLGTTPSSQRFKDEIKPMDKASESNLCARTGHVRYKKDLIPMAFVSLASLPKNWPRSIPIWLCEMQRQALHGPLRCSQRDVAQ